MAQGVFLSVALRNNRVQAVLSKLIERTEETIDAIAIDIQNRASQLAPVDTGALRNSIYRTNGEDSDYRDKSNAAKGLKDDAVLVPEVNPELVISPSGGDEASYMVIVGSAVQHGAIQEFGTAFMRAQPFMLPAALGLQEDLVQQISNIGNEL